MSFDGTTGIVVMVFFAVMMLTIGWFASKGVSSSSAKSYYISGGGLGFVALFFTLYATQYSGNSVVGYAPTAYRDGFLWWQSVPFMIAVVAVYLLYAPRMYVLAKRRGFISPTDWVRHRFGSGRLVILTAVVMLWGLGNYLLEQLVAMGQAVAGLTGETIPYQVGVIGFVLVMLAYSWAGGMRAIAFTDVAQGIMLLIGVATLLFGALYLIEGDVTGATESLAATDPDKVAVPSPDNAINWLSMVLLIGFGAAVYPHAIQRIYAARSERVLKRSIAAAAWMPLVTTAVVFVVGIAGTQIFPGLSDGESEQLVGMIAARVAEINLWFFVMMVLLFGGIVAAIVSTADSALLAFSTVVSRDMYGRWRPESSEKRQVMVGKVVGIVLVAVLLVIAWNPPGTLFQIFVLKFELIVQLAPVFLLGLYWRRLAAGPTFWGMLVGVVVAGAMTYAGFSTVYGVPGGLIGLAVNLAICILGTLAVTRRGDGSPITSEVTTAGRRIT